MTSDREEFVNIRHIRKSSPVSWVAPACGDSSKAVFEVRGLARSELASNHKCTGVKGEKSGWEYGIRWNMTHNTDPSLEMRCPPEGEEETGMFWQLHLLNLASEFLPFSSVISLNWPTNNILQVKTGKGGKSTPWMKHILVLFLNMHAPTVFF